MPKSLTITKPTKKMNDERSPIDETLVKNPIKEKISHTSESSSLSRYPETGTYISNPLDNQPIQIMKMDENLKAAIKDVLSEEIKGLTSVIQDNYIKLTDKIKEKTNTVTDI